jgi:hypothetical protein
MWLNCTTWINTTISETSKIRTEHLSDVFCGVSSVLEKRKIDNLWFVLQGSNATCYATYDHNDNYDTYHACRWDDSYVLEGKEKEHIHLPRSLITSWLYGNISGVEAIYCEMAIRSGIEWGIEEILSELGISSASIAAMLGISPELPGVAVFIFMLCYEIYETLETLAKLWGYLSTIYWLLTVVREHFSGDAWAWMGNIWSGYIIQLFDPLEGAPMTVDRYWDIRYWEQSWGAEGIYSTTPHQYIIGWWFRNIVKCPSSTARFDFSNRERDWRHPFP